MKRYIVSVGRAVNMQASKTGIKYVFDGRCDNPEKVIEQYKKHPEWYGKGIRIKDSLTNEVVFER